MNAKEGGPAFPCDVFEPDSPAPLSWQGMTLRDYFAAAALTAQGLGKSGMGSDHIAATAYALADAMLAERSK